MDLEKIKEIVNSNSFAGVKEQLILSVIAADKNSLPTILSIMDMERKQKNELISEMNLELSRANVHIQNPTLLSGSGNDSKSKISQERKAMSAKLFILTNISKFYQKWSHTIGHCFNMESSNEELKKDIESFVEEEIKSRAINTNP